MNFTLLTADMVLIVKDTDKFIGIATLFLNFDKKTILVDALCSIEKGIGTYIMNAVKKIAKDIKFNTIVLNSVPSSVGFFTPLHI